LVLLLLNCCCLLLLLPRQNRLLPHPLRPRLLLLSALLVACVCML
jgi:hypothetical protein